MVSIIGIIQRRSNYPAHRVFTRCVGSAGRRRHLMEFGGDVWHQGTNGQTDEQVAPSYWMQIVYEEF